MKQKNHWLYRGFSAKDVGFFAVGDPDVDCDSFNQSIFALSIAGALDDIMDGHEMAGFCNEQLGIPCQYEGGSLWSAHSDECQSAEEVCKHVVAQIKSMRPEVDAAFYSRDEMFFVVKVDPAFPMPTARQASPSLQPSL